MKTAERARSSLDPVYYFPDNDGGEAPDYWITRERAESGVPPVPGTPLTVTIQMAFSKLGPFEAGNWSVGDMLRTWPARQVSTRDVPSNTWSIDDPDNSPRSIFVHVRQVPFTFYSFLRTLCAAPDHMPDGSLERKRTYNFRFTVRPPGGTKDVTFDEQEFRDQLWVNRTNQPIDQEGT